MRPYSPRRLRHPKKAPHGKEQHAVHLHDHRDEMGHVLVAMNPLLSKNPLADFGEKRARVVLDGSTLTLQDLIAISRRSALAELSPDSYKAITWSRSLVERWVEQEVMTYGINTGFGALQKVAIARADVERLQENIILSHSAGVGPDMARDEVRAMMALRINTFAKGKSGVRPEVVDVLLRLLNNGITPVVPSEGSVGSSGDLAPLAHLALVLIGRGDADVGGERIPGNEALALAGLEPITLRAKEGLALTNGTQFMTSLGSLALWDARTLVKVADIAGAMTLEALKGKRDAFARELHNTRPYPGQIATAAAMRRLTQESELLDVADPDTADVHQDAYSLRCIPQVHGATRLGLDFVSSIMNVEMNSANDNPLVFAEQDEKNEGRVLSGGNFHGQPVALAIDVLSTSVSELGSISERRTARLLDERQNRGLPGFLIEDSGVNSGMMIGQYTAAALASRNKILVHPGGSDSIPTCANQEDHNSMGAISAIHARQVVDNVRIILAIELMCASQALEFRKNDGLRPGIGVRSAWSSIRSVVPQLAFDRELAPDICLIAELIANETIVDEVEKSVGCLP